MRESVQQTATRDRQLMHNCSTWGGNSGGPMLKAGTNIVFGLPSTYRTSSDSAHASDSSTMNADELARLDLVSYFVLDHAETLAAWGVDIYR